MGEDCAMGWAGRGKSAYHQGHRGCSSGCEEVDRPKPRRLGQFFYLAIRIVNAIL